MAAFAPRASYAVPATLPRSYYLGHHAAGLARMRTLLSSVDLVLEVRDFRAPLTSRNPMLEAALRARDGDGGGPRARIVVYAKRDLGAAWGGRGAGAAAEAALRRRVCVGEADDVFFLASSSSSSSSSEQKAVPRGYGAQALLERVRAHARGRFSVTGTRVLVAGMPNVGKSTLLNGLRRGGAKVAATGGLPGVTRRGGGPVKILEGWEVDGLRGPPPSSSEEEGGLRGAGSEPVYVHDTPGVFMPYVPSGEAMLKLALCGAVKEGLVPAATLADYLLWRVNVAAGPAAYAALQPAGAGPTDDVLEFLERVARRTGRLGPGGRPDLDAAAVWFVQRWRAGHVGRFLLDDVFADEEHDAGGALDGVLRNDAGELISINQARKAEKERRRERTRERLRARKER